MLEREFPILEFDEDRNPFIKPSALIHPADIAENCVLCFFSETIEKILAEYPHRIDTRFRSESLRLPVYELEYNNSKIALIQAGVGAPIAGSQIEELTAWAAKNS